MNSITKSANIVAIIPEFVELQHNLIRVFRQTFPQITDWEYLLDCPRLGCLWAEGEEWQFQRHGVGICFTGQKSGKVVDVNVGISYPQAFNAWRLGQYFESSIGIDKVDYMSDIFWILEPEEELGDDGKIEELLNLLIKDNFIAIASPSPKLYQLND